MKKIVLSTLAALSIATVASAGDVKFYSDANGQVYTTAAEGRSEVKMPTPIFSKSDKLDFSMLAYVGYQTTDYRAKSVEDKSQFELRRMYFQVKAHLLEDPKSYFRITLDSTSSTADKGMRIKYAYLYLNNILPFTGVEIGQGHRPWIDYEEHNGWFYRNIEKTLTEQSNGADLSNSADLGVNFKTKTEYFTSEIGVFNGEGYHAAQNSNGMSLEWRLTAAMLGGGKAHRHATKDTWFDASFFGQYNTRHKSYTDSVTAQTFNEDLVFGALHTVYNQPSFLVSAQYMKSMDTRSGSHTVSGTASDVSAQAGSGYSANFEARFGEKYDYRLFGRYDSWTKEQPAGTTEYAKRTYIGGAAWEMNKNVQWVANVITHDNEGGDTANSTEYMLTAQVEF